MHLRERLAEIIELKRHRLRANSLQQLQHRLQTFVNFLERRGCTTSEALTLRLILDYMRTWKFNDATAVIQTRTLKFFLKRISREDIREQIDTPRETRAGKARRRPKPYTDKEIAAFRTVADPLTELFFLTSIQTGLAVSDLVQLTPNHLREGCVVTQRQKTGKEVVIPVSPQLYNSLRLVLPFWKPRFGDPTRFQTGVTIWSDRMRVTQQKAGIWQKGSLTHRGRDTFVEKQLQAGVKIQVIAARLGDLVSTVERHYADLLSPRMREANLEAPVVTL